VLNNRRCGGFFRERNRFQLFGQTGNKQNWLECREMNNKKQTGQGRRGQDFGEIGRHSSKNVLQRVQ
jgi:hypothetical protein